MKTMKLPQLIAVNNTESMEIAYFEYLSFMGLVQVLHKNQSGLNNCYDALKTFSSTPEIYINLAYAELSLGNRSRGVQAIEKCLQYHPDFIYAQHFNGYIGKRKITNLKNIKSRKTILGKLLRRNKNQSLISIVEKVFKEMLHHKIESHIRLNSF